MALFRTHPYRICDARMGVTHMAFQWCPDVPPSTLPKSLLQSYKAEFFHEIAEGCWATIERTGSFSIAEKGLGGKILEILNGAAGEN